ncbi:alpha-glucan family phosphorylase [Terriglobus albidus]|uniref:glycogen phosphorylase n=1 Tax=Terriglobus albidus TaxID=1592106 RepID=A0A5B9E9R0_9BACT|nr:alpha-glucan family phosphorylase [Terriglobus albidus]QEE26816.1 alpha-glucan family phosphorylase [Terriglobus albidus]
MTLQDVAAEALRNSRVAYFSMEIALEVGLPTYSGGLGVLAGDTLRSAADMGVPMVAVTLAHRKGYFRQMLDSSGRQTEAPMPWSPEGRLPSAGAIAAITVQNRELLVRAWRYDIVGVTGHVIPVLLLDTDVEPNDSWDRTFTDTLYGGDHYYRLCQEAVLGLGGIALLHALGVQPEVFHMNEGHAALLTTALLEARLNGRPLNTATDEDVEAIKQQCVFTTHTPVPAGHDRFGYDQMLAILGQERTGIYNRFGGIHDGLLNMTYVALRFSRYVNGVAMQHGKVSQQMFPDTPIHYITNGVHAGTWVSPAMADLFDRKLDGWRADNYALRGIYGVEPQEIAAAHALNKQRLIETVKERTGVILREDVLTLGFARRAATYKRATLLFEDTQRLLHIAEAIGGLQVVYAGKAHPADAPGKALIHEVISAAQGLKQSPIHVVYLENYDMNLGALLTAGVDIWLNTPRRPYEASGTSGMKATLNGVPNLSILDGWWIEGCAEGSTGWAIEDGVNDEEEAVSLYEKLEKAVGPAYLDKQKWAKIMQHAIGINGAFFNTQRMVDQYICRSYRLDRSTLQPTALVAPVGEDTLVIPTSV